MSAPHPIARLSRRRFLGCGTAACAAAALPFPAAAGAADLITAGVTIAGCGPYRFVVDTGADRTVLAQDIADTLGLARRSRASVVGVARTVTADTVHAGRLDLGTLTTEALDLPILPRAWLGADGYLGLDMIDKHRVTFDFRNRVLALSDSPSSYFLDYSKADETVLRAGGARGRIRSDNCRVDGVRAVAFLDTGAEISVGNSKLFEALAREGGSPLLADAVTLTGVTGGSILGGVVAVERARLGGFDLGTSGLAIADLPIFELWGLAGQPALFIGMDFLSRFSKVTIDYGRKQYRLELAALALASRV